jgi:amino acid permease
MSKKRVLGAVATLVGCTIGAGILGLPYIFAKAGFLTGLLNVLVIGILALFINLYLGEVTLRTKGRHQLMFYAEKYLGKRGRYAMFASMLVGIYGALIAYTIGGGVALSSIFGYAPLFWSIAFFAVLAGVIYLGLGAIERSESFIIVFILGVVMLIFALSIRSVSFDNLSVFSVGSLFVPYGMVLFAFIGTSAIPEMREELHANKKALRRAILLGTLIPMAVYIIFTLSVVGVMGITTHEVGSIGIAAIVGERLAFVGGLFAVLTMSTSFLVLGLALNDMFRFDYRYGRLSSWLLACAVPFFLFLLLEIGGMASFTTVIEYTGITSGVATGIMVFLMAISAKKSGDRTPEYSLFINPAIAGILMLMLVFGGVFMLTGLG